jgi:hypothetical protein
MSRDQTVSATERDGSLGRVTRSLRSLDKGLPQWWDASRRRRTIKQGFDQMMAFQKVMDDELVPSFRDAVSWRRC